MTDDVPQPGKSAGVGDHVVFSDGTFHGPVLGKGTQHNHYGASRPPAEWPHQVGVIPPRACSFQDRAETVRLRGALTGGQAAVLVGQNTVRGQVLSGMGGVGKTQLAADYARTAWKDGHLDVLVWVTASARSPVVDGYAQAGVELCRADPDEPEQAARTFLAWLTPKAGQKPCRWLVVLDDVADPDDLVVNPNDPDNRYNLWPPASPYGRTLVTTRRRDAALTGEGRRMVEVGLFTETEASAYLTRSLADRGREEPAGQLTALAADLGYLPLALAQAAAYLVDSGQIAAAYRALLADRTATLADAAPDRLPDDQTIPLAAAWSLSLDRADILRPAGLARPMLQLAALLDANGIPEAVLTSPPALAHLAHHRPPTLPGAARRPGWWPGKRQHPLAQATSKEATDALRALHRLSLINHTPTAPHQTVRVHQLIQRATRDTLTPDQLNQLARTAADALISAWPDIECDTALAQALRANTYALTNCAQDALYTPDIHEVLYRTGYSLGESGQVNAAISHFQHMLDTAATHHSPDHPDTLATRRSLAFWRGVAGGAAGAAAALAELLTHTLRVRGKDHPDTLATRHDLAFCRGRAGDAAGAAAALAELLTHTLRVRGKDHPDTLTIRHDLAWWRGQAGDAAGAATALAELLPHTVRVLGKDHPDTLTTRLSLAYCRGQAGDAAGAATAFAELLPHTVRVLGKDHPDTLTTRRSLAQWRGEAGDASGAAAALAELLPHIVRVLGKDHPHTLATRGDLARWRGEAGDASGAAAALAELLPHMVRVLGKDHPDTVTTRHNLADWRGRAGDASGPAG
ncbi:tetratricopeptide repeat protein [Streptomyces olivochromogenes]|uniref:tetratricopeptide repeat protein n=1 Tax=Streptomyces olivochromogenes TaxID=1963 RepID=UPI0027E4B9E0|nr:NB-ARC domain-containing protein [Streptomyces olivochromogenes]